MIAPDLFWRQEPGVQLDPETDRERATELMKRVDPALAVPDSITAATHRRTLDGVDEDVGVVGYCLGGKRAFLLSMEKGIDAAVSYYGTGIHTLVDRIDEVRCPLLLHVAEQDHLCPPEAQVAIEQTALRKPDLVTVMRYPGVGHAFARPTSPVFDRASAERADQATIDLLRANLVGTDAP